LLKLEPQTFPYVFDNKAGIDTVEVLLENCKLPEAFFSIVEFRKLLILAPVKLNKRSLENSFAETSYHKVHDVFCLFTLLLNNVANFEALCLN